MTHLLFCATSENTCLVDLFSDHMILLLIVGIVTNCHIIPINQDFIHSICFKASIESNISSFPHLSYSHLSPWSWSKLKHSTHPGMNPLTGTSTTYGTTQHLPASTTHGHRWSTWPGRRVWVLYLDMTHSFVGNPFRSLNLETHLYMKAFESMVEDINMMKYGGTRDYSNSTCFSHDVFQW